MTLVYRLDRVHAPMLRCTDVLAWLCCVFNAVALQFTVNPSNQTVKILSIRPDDRKDRGVVATSFNSVISLT